MDLIAGVRLYVCMHSWSHFCPYFQQNSITMTSFGEDPTLFNSISILQFQSEIFRWIWKEVFFFYSYQFTIVVIFFRAYTLTHIARFYSIVIVIVIANKKYSPLDCRCQTFEAKRVLLFVFQKMMKVCLLLKPLLFHFFQLFLLCTEKRHRPINTISLCWVFTFLSIDSCTNDKNGNANQTQNVLCFLLFATLCFQFVVKAQIVKKTTKW